MSDNRKSTGWARGRGRLPAEQGVPMPTSPGGCSGMADLGSRTMSESSMSSSFSEVFEKGVTINEGATCDAVLAPKKAPATRCLKKIVLDTNIWEINLPHIPLYRYDITMDLIKGSKTESLNKGPRDDFKVIDRKEKCRNIFRVLCNVEKSTMGDHDNFAYDGVKTLYSVKELNIQTGKTVTIPRTQLMDKVELADQCVGVMVEIKPCAESFEMVLDDFKSAIEPDLSKHDRSLRSALEMITSQSAINNGEHIFFGGGKSALYTPEKYGLQYVELSEGKYLAVGADKGVRVMSKTNGAIMAGIVLDTKKLAFYYAQPVLTTLAAIFEISEEDLKQKNISSDDRSYLQHYFKDLRLQKDFGDKETFQVAGLASNTVDNLFLDDDRQESEKERLVDWLQKQHQKILRYPNLPCFIERRLIRGLMRSVYYPMELCTICDNQRVPNEKLELQMREIIKASAVKPFIRLGEIQKVAASLNLSNGGVNNEILRNCSISTKKNPTQVEAGILPSPTPKYGGTGNTKARVNDGRANWRSGAKFAEPAKIAHWVAIVSTLQAPDDKLKSLVRKFIDKLVNFCCKKGMALPKLNDGDIVYIPPVPTKMSELFTIAKNRDARYLLYIEYNIPRNKTLHHHLKYLEHEFLIITQQVNSKAVEEVVNTPVEKPCQTLENIANKVNVKNDGLNYCVVPDEFVKCPWLTNGELMIVGYDVSHPPSQPMHERQMKKPQSQPSTIGMSFNGAKNPEYFMGDYHYQQPRKEAITVEILKDRFVWMLTEFKNARNCRLPKNLLVYRDGISEGQYKMLIMEEVKAIRQGIEEVGGIDYKPLLTVVIATKRHNRRFFFGEENPPPGIVVDNGITRVDCTEFYLQSHRAIQGTAKATDYTVPVDDSLMSLDQLQAITHALCYHHQIVTSAVSLPEPVYQADAWATRGKNNFNVYLKDKGENVPRTENGEIDFEEVTNQLCYKGTLLAHTRVNA